MKVNLASLQDKAGWEAAGVKLPKYDVMAMRDFYRSLIAMRKANDFIMHADVQCEVLDDNVIEVRYLDGEKLIAYALINPNGDAEFELPEGEWQVLMANETIYPDGGETVNGTVPVNGRTVLLVRAE